VVDVHVVVVLAVVLEDPAEVVDVEVLVDPRAGGLVVVDEKVDPPVSAQVLEQLLRVV